MTGFLAGAGFAFITAAIMPRRYSFGLVYMIAGVLALLIAVGVLYQQLEGF